MFFKLKSSGWTGFLGSAGSGLFAALTVHSAPFKTVELKVLLGFGGALLLILFGCGIIYQGSASFAEPADLVAHTQKLHAMLTDFRSNLRAAEAAERNYALVEAMEAAEINLLKEHEANTLQTRQFTLLYMLITLLLAMALLTALFVAIRREIRTNDTIEARDGTLSRALLHYSSTLDREKILDGLLDLLAQRHAYPVSAIYIYEEWRGELVRRAGHGLPPCTPVSFHIGEGMVGLAAQSGKTVYLDDPGSGWISIATGVGSITPAALLAVPVTFCEQRHGVLVLASITQLTEQDKAFVEHIANQLGVALNNFKQFSELKFMAEQLHVRGEEISKKNLQLEEASRTKSEFLANMSHELRTPLNAIIGFSEALKDGLMGEVVESQREYIDDIYTSGEHLLSLINDILDLAKVESGKMQLELAPVTLAAMLHNSLKIVKEKAISHSLNVRLEIEENMPQIVADARKLKQIVYNLLGNAIKFTPDGGAITLGARQMDGMLEIYVSDTGIGISAEDQARLFQSFSQIDSVRSRQDQGTGLGLIMVRRLAELHGGSAGLESEPGKGSRFWARVPWRQAAEFCALQD